MRLLVFAFTIVFVWTGPEIQGYSMIVKGTIVFLKEHFIVFFVIINL